MTLFRMTSFGHLVARLGQNMWEETRLMVTKPYSHPHADVLRASSRVPSFHLCDDWLTDHRCSVPIQKRDVYQLLIKFSSPLLCPWVNCLQDTEIFSP